MFSPHLTFVQLNQEFLYLKPSDQDPHCFPLWLYLPAYNWKAACEHDKNRGEVL